MVDSFEPVFWLLVLAALAIPLYVIVLYNRLIEARRTIDEAWANIDVLLKQRSDELPKLIETVREYMSYEEQVLEDLTEARTQVERASTPAEEGVADSAVRRALTRLWAVAEDYPDLRASENFQQLQTRISSLEERISDRRETYNERVNAYNIRIHQVPYNLLAPLMRCRDQPLFQVADEDLEDIDVAAAFADGAAS